MVYRLACLMPHALFTHLILVYAHYLSTMSILHLNPKLSPKTTESLTWLLEEVSYLIVRIKEA